MPLNRIKNDTRRRVLVTGSRGKSSIVRLVQTALQSAGLQSYARITGVTPRELSPNGTRAISRSSGAHVEEMRWWLKNLPVSTQAIIMENSAITPDLQGLAGAWLQPGFTVLSNVLPDHQEAWGPGSACAAEVLTAGIPKESKVVLPADLKTDHYLLELLQGRRCDTNFVKPVPDVSAGFQSTNIALALATVEQLGLETGSALKAMLKLRRDSHDFRVVDCGGAELAMAFSANDIFSTRSLFQSLSWSEEETCLVYNHRRDRPGRFRSFLDWLNNANWRELLIIGDRPPMRHCSGSYLRTKNAGKILRLFRPGERVFGCGNIAGLPLELAADLDV